MSVSDHVKPPSKPTPDAGASRLAVSKLTKLQMRLLSGLAMVAASLAVTWVGGWLFAVMAAAIGALMLWEWNRMVCGSAADVPNQVMAGYLALVASVAAIQFGALLAVPMIIVLAAVFLGLQRSLLGVGAIYVIPPIIALIWLRADPDFGFIAATFLFVSVWATDTFAMVFGKAVGGPRLLPQISPNKTWSGALGGLLAAAGVCGAFVVFFVPEGQWWYGVLVGSMLSVCAQVGDLVESAVKRACKIKDTSGLIPGHGGVLDRMDGIVGAAVGMMLAMIVLWPDVPARFLVTGG